MNDTDIQLISSLVDGRLLAAEAQDALARIQGDSELEAAYEQQLAVSSLLRSAPVVSMTAAESDTMRATLRSELHLDAAPAPAAAMTSRWSRWWAPVTGLATVAVVVSVLVIVPDLLGDGDPIEVAGPAAQTTAAPSLASDPLAGTEGTLEQDGIADNAGETTPTTSVAAESGDPEALSYALAPASAYGAELELPVFEDDSIDMSSLGSVLSRSAGSTSVDIDAVSRCFGPGTGAQAEISLVGVTPDGGAVIGVATNPETGIETVVLIDLTSCEVTSAG